MNPQIIFAILRANGGDLLAIEEKIGGLGGIIRLEPQLYAIYEAYAAGGADAVLMSCGPHIQAVIEAIGPGNIAAVMPYLAKILKTVHGGK